jgi:polyhydroxybutyrate depolymerase
MRLSVTVAVLLTAASWSSNGLAQSQPALCALAASPGVSGQQFSSGGLPRSYRLFVPSSYDGRTRLPLVLNLHGSGGTADRQAGSSQFEALAEREGFLVATLQASPGTGNRWNVPITDDRPDDVAYVSDVIDQVAATVCTDAARVYATGFSGGARMSSLLACELNSRIAAIAPMSGLRWPGPCDGRAIPVLTLHGLADPQNTYDGYVENRGGEWVESVPEALAGWARHNGCDADVVFEDPAGPQSTLHYEGCRNDVAVSLIRIDGLTHQWARDEVDATAVMWEFFRNQSL